LDNNFYVYEPDEHMESVKKAGGKNHGNTMDISGVGRWVMFTHTEGNHVGILQPKM